MSSINRELREAARENNLPQVSRLLSVGADVNAKDIYGDRTPLHWACAHGHMQVFNELVEHGADVEATDRHGSTPLHYAISQDHLPVVKALLSGGADILAANNQGNNPIISAVRNRRSKVAKYLLRQMYATTRRLPLHELLIDLTWIGNLDTSDVPPLREALHENVLRTDDVVEIIEYLVDRDPTLLRSRDPDGSLPLHVACRCGAAFTIVQSLVDRYKASVTSVTSEGDLPLFLACEIPEPYLDTIFLLMKMYPDLVYR
jgi:ankyrin repeat protein